jgi:hypothetical protein
VAQVDHTAAWLAFVAVLVVAIIAAATALWPAAVSSIMV